MQTASRMTPDSGAASPPATPTGSAAAALIATGLGVFALGLFTTLAVISEPFKNKLNWWDPAGPLSGKAGYAVIVWLVGWMVLHLAVGQRDIRLGAAIGWTIMLLALGFLGTFPPFFEAFEHSPR